MNYYNQFHKNGNDNVAADPRSIMLTFTLNINRNYILKQAIICYLITISNCLTISSLFFNSLHLRPKKVRDLLTAVLHYYHVWQNSIPSDYIQKRTIYDIQKPASMPSKGVKLQQYNRPIVVVRFLNNRRAQALNFDYFQFKFLTSN